MVLTNPNNIPGLTLWVDAADDSTVNNGRVTNGQNVFKIVDKASGITFRNGYGVDGPSYSVGTVNGKNVITFNYYTSPNSILVKGLWADNVTTMATGTYSLYCVSFPYDNRQRNTNGAGTPLPQNLWLLSLVNNLPTSVGGYQPNRVILFRTSGGLGVTNSAPQFQEDTDFTFTSTTTLYDRSNQTTPGINSIPKSDPRYIYGKTNVIGVRASDGVKRFTNIRRDYISNESFQPGWTKIAGAELDLSRKSRTPPQGFTPAVGGPWLTIGSIFPNPTTTNVEGVAGPMSDFILNAATTSNVYGFEGHFCEFLFFNRVLTDSESNSVEKYLTKKWI